MSKGSEYNIADCIFRNAASLFKEYYNDLKAETSSRDLEKRLDYFAKIESFKNIDVIKELQEMMYDWIESSSNMWSRNQYVNATPEQLKNSIGYSGVFTNLNSANVLCKLIDYVRNRNTVVSNTFYTVRKVVSSGTESIDVSEGIGSFARGKTVYPMFFFNVGTGNMNMYCTETSERLLENFYTDISTGFNNIEINTEVLESDQYYEAMMKVVDKNKQYGYKLYRSDYICTGVRNTSTSYVHFPDLSINEEYELDISGTIDNRLQYYKL